MSCRCLINGSILELSEAELLGILCSIIDTFNISPQFDVEVLYTKSCTFISQLWTLKTNLTDIVSLCQKLKHPAVYECVKVFPLGSIKAVPINYYLPKNLLNDFKIGYSKLSSLLSMVIDANYVIYNNYWPADRDFLSKTTFISGPGDNIQNTRKFQMIIPSYLWELPIDSRKDASIYIEQSTSNLINLFLTKCSSKDHELLVLGNHYIRIFIYQDNPHSDRYCYISIRELDSIIYQNHKITTKSCSNDHRLCEINYSQKAFLFEIPLREWNTKSIRHIEDIV